MRNRSSIYSPPVARLFAAGRGVIRSSGGINLGRLGSGCDSVEVVRADAPEQEASR
jgi:hypothetical protein